MNIFRNGDERAKKEVDSINTAAVMISVVVALLSLVIKAFYGQHLEEEYTKLGYGIRLTTFDFLCEYLTLGIALIYAIIILVVLLKSKRLDERLKIILSRIGTIFFLLIHINFLIVLTVIFFRYFSINAAEPLQYFTCIPFILACTTAINIYRIIKTRTITNTAAKMTYGQYKKRIMRISLIASSICLVIAIMFGIMAPSNPFLINIFMIFLFGAPACFLQCFILLRGKKLYDKEADFA